MTILVLAEHDGKTIKSSTLRTITAATQLAKEIDSNDIKVLLAGFQCAKLAEKLATIDGVTEVLLADNEVYQHPLAERFAPLMLDVITESTTHILAPATTFGKNILPRVAAMLDLGQISDITAILSKDTYERATYAGSVIETVKSLDPQQLITVRSAAFEPANASSDLNSNLNSGAAPITAIDYVSDNQQSCFVSQETQSSTRPELSSAELIISGGRGLQNKENFQRLVKIADALQAAIGASRAAVDASFAPNDWQVGQTGQVVAPKLYIAVGISGAVQHLAGMKESETIIAINKDADAPIFQIADYGLVADINEVLPAWEKALGLSS